VTFTPHLVDPELDLELTRQIPVTPGAVFAAWTDPESIKQWFAPRPYSISVSELELRPGGGFRTAMNSPEGEELFDSTGCYLDIVPEERLVWTSALATGYRPQPDDMPFTAILELRPDGTEGCHYRAIAMHQSPDDRRKHEEMGFHHGWGTVIDQLVEHLQNRPTTESE
jgi:uncharacterized protein YndB with AHSA1/START domain